jgi:hypothetical protein
MDKVTYTPVNTATVKNYATTEDFKEAVIQENNVKLSLVPSKRKKIKKINMIIEGEFNISNAQVVKDNCSKLLQHFDTVSITLKNITDIDLAAIQLLHVLKSSPGFAQRTVTIDSELSKEDKNLINTAGLMGVITTSK